MGVVLGVGLGFGLGLLVVSGCWVVVGCIGFGWFGLVTAVLVVVFIRMVVGFVRFGLRVGLVVVFGAGFFGIGLVLLGFNLWVLVGMVVGTG